MIDNKNILLILLVLTLLFTILTIVVVADGGIPSISARSSVLYEPVTQTFVFEKNADEKLPMASTTKIMTALIAIEQCNLDKKVLIPSEATGIEGSSIYLKENDEISIRDLVYSVLLQSANDAATALALEISGDVKSFADMMNERAMQIGLSGTSFENPHGLDSSEHYTTARDLALLAAEALKNPTFSEICATYKYTFNISDTPRTIVNHNKMLKLFNGAFGVKTGYTDKSGRCLVASAKRDGISLISVTLNAPDDWNDHKKLLNYGFDKFEAVSLCDIINTSFTVPVKNGTQNQIKASVSDGVIIPRDKSSGELNAKIEIPDTLYAPIYKGDKIGKITVYTGKDTVIDYDVTALETIELFNNDIGYFDFIKEHFTGSNNGKDQTSKIYCRCGCYVKTLG